MCPPRPLRCCPQEYHFASGLEIADYLIYALDLIRKAGVKEANWKDFTHKPRQGGTLRSAPSGTLRRTRRKAQEGTDVRGLSGGAHAVRLSCRLAMCVSQETEAVRSTSDGFASTVTLTQR
jgi:hypothetical protein